MRRKPPKPYDPVKMQTAVHAYDASVQLNPAFVYGSSYPVFQLRRAFAAALAEGGYVCAPANKKEIKQLPKLIVLQTIALVFVAMAFVVYLYGFIMQLTGVIEKNAGILLLPMQGAMLVFWLNAVGLFGRTSVVIFCDEYYLSGPFKVAYEKITSVVVKEKTAYNKATVVAITLHCNGKQVGHDRMYVEDYEHLLGIIDAFARHKPVSPPPRESDAAAEEVLL